MTAFSFSYTPKPSTALAGINPIQSRGEGLRFAANTPMSFIQQRPEVLAEGYWKGRQALTEGIVKGVTSAVGGVAGALSQKAADAKADTKLKEDRAHEIEVAKIKSQPTELEKAYQQQRSDLLTQQIAAAKTKNDDVTTAASSAPVAPSEVDFFSDLREIPDYKLPVEAPTSSDTPANNINSAPPTKTPAPTAPAAINPPTPPAGVSQYAPGDAGRGLFQFDQGTGTDAYGNMPPRQDSMAFNIPTQVAESPETAIVSSPSPESIPFSNTSIFNRQSNTPGFVPVNEAIKNRSPIVDLKNVAPSENLTFSDINAISPQAEPSTPPYLLADVELPKRTMGALPENVGPLLLKGESLPLVPVSGAEEKPLAKTPPPVEPQLPQAVPKEPLEAKAVPFTQDEVRYYLEDKYTSRPYQSPADANMAKKLLEQKLGVKVEIDTEKGEKGTRLYHVRIAGDAPAPKTAPEGFFIESIRDADGKETYVYKPKIPVKQQIATFDNNIEKAKVLKKTLQKIEEIAPSAFGVFGGAGGISGLMKYNPIANDARTTRALLDTVKGIVGFDELVALKAQGGSLGALSDSELKMLTSLKGSLDPDMDEKTFTDNIKSMRESTDRLISGLEEDKKQVTNVEKKTNFQPIQNETSNYQKGVTAFIKDGRRYVWDGTIFKLSN